MKKAICVLATDPHRLTQTSSFLRPTMAGEKPCALRPVKLREAMTFFIRLCQTNETSVSVRVGLWQKNNNELNQQVNEVKRMLNSFIQKLMAKS